MQPTTKKADVPMIPGMSIKNEGLPPVWARRGAADGCPRMASFHCLTVRIGRMKSEH